MRAVYSARAPPVRASEKVRQHDVFDFVTDGYRINSD